MEVDEQIIEDIRVWRWAGGFCTYAGEEEYSVKAGRAIDRLISLENGAQEKTSTIQRVEIHLLHQSSPVLREEVRNTYAKGGLFCVMRSDGVVEKYPIEHLFRVVEHD